jgi:hypothetical protein
MRRRTELIFQVVIFKCMRHGTADHRNLALVFLLAPVAI